MSENKNLLDNQPTWDPYGLGRLSEQAKQEVSREERTESAIEQARRELREEQIRQIHEDGIKKFKHNLEEDIKESSVMNVSPVYKNLKVQAIKLDEEDISHLIDFLNGVGRETKPGPSLSDHLKVDEKLKKKSLKKLAKHIKRVQEILEASITAAINEDYEQIEYFEQKLKTFK